MSMPIPNTGIANRGQHMKRPIYIAETFFMYTMKKTDTKHSSVKDL
jgi:hypothetical protein